MVMTLTFGSLFAGIGGMDLGLERAGMEPAWQVEINDHATQILAKHWPDVPRYRDVRDVGAGTLAHVDVIAGGFPCQDLSYAGRGAGLDGERSGLWAEYARIVRELRPRFVVVENVPALLGRGLGRVLGDLAESGYDAEWDCLPAAAVGAPQRRDRLWIVAHRRGERLEGQQPGRPASGPAGRSGRGIAAVDPLPVLRCGELPLHDPHGACLGVPVPWDGRGAVERPLFGAGAWSSGPWVFRVAPGVPRRMDRIRGLGNAVVPQVAEWVGGRIVAAVIGRAA